MFRGIVVAIALIASVPHSKAQESFACDPQKLCPASTVCRTGGSITTEKLPGEESTGRLHWHSDVFFREVKGQISKFELCFYRVVRIKDATNLLPIYWQSAGLKFHGIRKGKNTGCVIACTDTGSSKGPPTEPVNGNIEFDTQAPKFVPARAWAPPSGLASDGGDLRPDPDAVTSTLVSHTHEAGVGFRLEFAARILPDGKVRYNVRNFGLTPVNVVWNIPKNDSIKVIEGPFTNSGMTVAKEPYQRDVDLASQPRDNGVKPVSVQSQVAVEVGGSTVSIFSLPTFGPNNGVFDTPPESFWKRQSLR